MIYVNGESREYAEKTSVGRCICRHGLNRQKIAIELNKEILPFQQYDTHLLQPEDRLEIVHAIGGGQEDSFVLQGSLIIHDYWSARANIKIWKKPDWLLKPVAPKLSL